MSRLSRLQLDRERAKRRCVYLAYSARTGALRGVYRAREAGIDTEGWATICEDHNTVGDAGEPRGEDGRRAAFYDAYRHDLGRKGEQETGALPPVALTPVVIAYQIGRSAGCVATHLDAQRTTG